LLYFPSFANQKIAAAALATATTNTTISIHQDLKRSIYVHSSVFIQHLFSYLVQDDVNRLLKSDSVKILKIIICHHDIVGTSPSEQGMLLTVEVF